MINELNPNWKAALDCDKLCQACLSFDSHLPDEGTSTPFCPTFYGAGGNDDSGICNCILATREKTGKGS